MAKGREQCNSELLRVNMNMASTYSHRIISFENNLICPKTNEFGISLYNFHVSIYSGNAAHLSPMEFKKGLFHFKFF
jgi:hypothetical protein